MNRFRRLFTRKDKKTTIGAEEPLEINWFAIVLLLAAGVLLCLLLYVLVISPLLAGDTDYVIVPFGEDDDEFTFTPPSTDIIQATPTSAPQPTITSTPAPAIAIDATTALRLAEIAPLNPISAEISSVAFSRNEEYVAASSFDGSVRVWDVLTLAQVHEFQSTSNRVNSIAFGPDGDRIVAGGQDNAVRLWSLEDGTETLLEGPTAAVRSVAYSPDGARIAAGSDDSVLYVWNATEDPPVLERLLSGHTSYVTSVAFSPDGLTIAAGGEDDTIRLWNTATGAPRSVLSDHTSTVTSVDFNPNGTRLVSTSADHTVKLWNLLTETAAVTMHGHTENVNDAAFSPDGSLIVSAGSGIEDNTMRFWDATTGLEVRDPVTRPGPVNAVAFAPDGNMLATGGATYLTLWGIPEDAPVAAPPSIDTATRQPGGPQTGIPASVPTTTPLQQTTTAPQQGGAVSCTLTVRVTEANLRSGPSTDYQIVGSVTRGQNVQATGWAQDAERYTWWVLANNAWVRGDAFIGGGATIPEQCLQLPAADPSSLADPVITDAPAVPASTSGAPTGATSCTLTVRAASADEHTGPAETYQVAGTLTRGQDVQATGWARAEDGYTWWLLANELWVRGDAFVTAANPSLPERCLSLPEAGGAVSATTGQTVQTGQVVQPTAPAAADTSNCTLTVRVSQASTRDGPGTDYTVNGSLSAGQTVQPTGWARADDGYTWWRLSTGVWARGDVFLDTANTSVPAACLSLPSVSAP